MSSCILVPIPYDGGTRIPGQRFAPKEIISDCEFYSPFILNKFKEQPYLNIINSSTYVSFNYIKDYVSKINKSSLPLFLGGDHSITLPIVEGYCKKGIEFEVIYLDAHLDVYPDQVLKNWNVFNEVQDIVKIWNIGYRSEIKEFPVEKISSFDIHEQLSKVDEYLQKIKCKNIYLSIDLDVYDPSYLPGVSDRVSLGLTPFQVKVIVEKIIRKFNVIGIDIVEYNPHLDIQKISLSTIRGLLETIVKEVNCSNDK